MPRHAARLNINLRCGARVMLVLADFPARSFEELFQGTRAVAWEDYLPRDAAFPVKGYSISSQLHAVPACQSIIKKAMVERMKSPIIWSSSRRPAPSIRCASPFSRIRCC